jgi:uncharacterized membrane protein YkgB
MTDNRERNSWCRLFIMRKQMEAIDSAIVSFMRRWGVVLLRYSLAVIFIWFGILKPLGLSAAEPLVEATTKRLPLLDPERWVVLLGWWEVLIGAGFLFRRTIRIAIGLLTLQMVGTLMPLVLFPETSFQPGHWPYAPTLEGQYIFKNLLIISGAMVVGGDFASEKCVPSSLPAPRN